ncbi:MAG: PEGA domain-containing protein, partial [Gallionella sp.]
IQDVPVTDRVILDTGDGAAINFLGDVEDALQAALSLREDLLSEGPDIVPPLLVRMGINLGPVRLVRDINGQPNIVGDGINVAQRVMGFADAAQILVSRSYYDAVSRLSPQYAGMFHYQGSRTDKHVREHEVYAIGYPGDKTTQKRRLAQSSGTSVIVESNFDRSKVLANDIWHSSIQQLDTLINNGIAKLQQAQPIQRVFYVSAAALPFLIMFAMLVSMNGNDNEAPVIQSKPNQVKLNNKASLHKELSAETVAVTDSIQEAQQQSDEEKADIKVGETDTAKAIPVRQAKKVVQEKPKVVQKVTPKPVELPKPRVRPEVVTKSTVGSAGGSTESRISVSCIEGTEVFIDGERKGGIESAPLVIATPPGMHSVIVSHPSGGIYSKNVKLGSGKTVEIRPKFCK